jgi:LPXTG-site transpeptidase (sortase) family protein
MNRKLFIVGAVSSLLLIACVGSMLALGLLGWISLAGAGEKKPVRVSLVAPLPTPNVQNRSAGPANAALPAEFSGPDLSQQSVAGGAEPARLAVETALTAAEAEVEQALGFALPAGSVNSVTRVGAATRLVIPSLGLDAPVIIAPIQNQTWVVDQLGQAIGHLEGTARPGANSNIVLAGHVTLAETNGGPGPFYKLSQLVPGDLLIVYEGEAKYEYVIDGLQTVDRTAVDVTFPTDTPQLTLITCTQWDRNEGRYLERLVVKSRLNQG